MADTTVKHFTSSMTGAPTVSRTAGSLIAMLDACLVDGFGLKSVDSVVVAGGVATVTVSTGHSAKKHAVVLMAGATGSWTALNGEKRALSAVGNTFTFDATGVADGTATGTITTKLSGAGWTKVFSGTNKAVYRSPNPASTQIYLRIDDSHAEYARPTGYLTMSDIDTGTGGYSTAYFNKADGAAGNRNWWLAANDKFVLFGVDTHRNGFGCVLFAFGDIIPRRAGDPYCFNISGSASPASNWGSTDVSASSLTNGGGGTNMLARSFTQLGGGVAASPAMFGTTSGSINSGFNNIIAFPNGGDNSVVLTDTYLIQGTTLRGRVPGMYLCPQAAGGALFGDYEITNIPELAGRTMLWKVLGNVSAAGGFGVDLTGPWE